MEDSNNYGHQHPLILLLNQEQLIDNQGGELADCSRCGEKVSAPCFSCVEHCGFYLHNVCAEAPLVLKHPFHPDHPLVLLQNPPSSFQECVCDFCGKICEKFIYHCTSCRLDFHIRCALFTFNIAENNLKELEHVALVDPSISTKNGDEESEDASKYCFGCWEPLENYTHFSPLSGLRMHKKCVELPLKLNDHMFHRRHPLVLQFNSEQLSCNICKLTQERGFVYGCSPCKFSIHIECVSPSQTIEHESHPHPFSLLFRQTPFICDACSTEGNVAYICSTCNIVIHKKCISFPRFIKSKWHRHPLFHNFFLGREDFTTLNCMICHDEVDTEHGSYYCSRCEFILHVNCATKEEDSYDTVSSENEDEESVESFIVIEFNDAGEAAVIEHFKHIHNLVLTDNIIEYYNKNCDGCLLPISASCYYCLECDFFLHEACAKLPKVMHVPYHHCQQPSILTSDDVFRCVTCDSYSHAFSYKCIECEECTCLRCVAALGPDAPTCPGHEHPLFFYTAYTGKCDACGDGDCVGMFHCKRCNYSLDQKCFALPITAQHKYDKHLLILTYFDDNSYPGSHYCDFCSESRDPSYWFYRCATCNTSAHVSCVLGEHPFIKLGSNIKRENHPHPLTAVRKKHSYPDCSVCDEPCLDLALECTEYGCDYRVHFECPE